MWTNWSWHHNNRNREFDLLFCRWVYICTVCAWHFHTELITVCDLWPIKPLTPPPDRQKWQMGLWPRRGDIPFLFNAIVLPSLRFSIVFAAIETPLVSAETTVKLTSSHWNEHSLTKHDFISAWCFSTFGRHHFALIHPKRVDRILNEIYVVLWAL